jgi:hypothetical protein
MRELDEIYRRIALVCSSASSEDDDDRVLDELGDVLLVGYASALQADARCRRLADEIERLSIDGEHSERAGELARERRTVADATRGLRDRLALVRTLFALVSARVDSA